MLLFCNTPGAETFYLETGAKNVFQLFLQTFAGEPAARTQGAANRDGLDELSLEESEYYKEKVTKWIRNGLQAVRDPVFWFCMTCANTTRSPLRHFYHVLCAKEDPSRMPIVELVTFRLGQIQTDFDNLNATFFTWTRRAIESSGFNDDMDDNKAAANADERICARGGAPGLASPTEKSLLEAALALLMVSASSFDRRFVRFFQRPGASYNYNVVTEASYNV